MAARINLSDLSKRLKGDTLDKYNTALKKATLEWSNIAGQETKELIVEMIQRGQSPVQGGRGQTGEQSRFYDYSKSYKEMIELARLHTTTQKKRSKVKNDRDLDLFNIVHGKTSQSIIEFARYNKRLRPVNLTLSGEMLRSIKRSLIEGGFSIWFSSKLAKYHTILGAGKSRIKRKMLPVDKDDQFTRLINKGLVDKFKSILSTHLGE